jgi:hypothetical protein
MTAGSNVYFILSCVFAYLLPLLCVCNQTFRFLHDFETVLPSRPIYTNDHNKEFSVTFLRSIRLVHCCATDKFLALGTFQRGIHPNDFEFRYADRPKAGRKTYGH